MKNVVGKMLSGVVVILPLLLAGDGVTADMPDLPRGKGDQCVEPTELMRKNHMDYLNHQRDLTVRSGIRTRKHSLVQCVQCHVQQDGEGRFISINAPGQFCYACHQFTGVDPDCFECHATQPDAEMPDDHPAQTSFATTEARQ